MSDPANTRTTRQGSCLCGAVSFSAEVSHSVGACHCSICLKWTGSPMMAVDCGTDVQFEGADNIGRYRSSEWAERGFCKCCGGHLFYHLIGQDQYVMALGVFDDMAGLVFDHQIFIEEKPSLYDFANDTKKMTGEELFALYAPEN